MAGSGDAVPESSREKRKREARLAFEERAAREAPEAAAVGALAIPLSPHAGGRAALRDHARRERAGGRRRAASRPQDRERSARGGARGPRGAHRAKRQALAISATPGRSCCTRAGPARRRISTSGLERRVDHAREGVAAYAPPSSARPRRRTWRCGCTERDTCRRGTQPDGYRPRGVAARGCPELHGTVFREKCENEACAVTELARDFDVTARKPHNGRHRHKTGRACPGCGGDLRDVVVQFGERLDDDVLAKATEVSRDAKLSLVMGTSLKIPPASRLPRLSETLVIVNLQWTAEDKRAALKMPRWRACSPPGGAPESPSPSRPKTHPRVVAAGETFAGRKRISKSRAGRQSRGGDDFHAGEGRRRRGRPVRVGGEDESKKHSFAPLSSGAG